MLNEFENEGVGSALLDLCDHIAYDPATGEISGPKGWAATRGVNFVIERLQTSSAMKNATGNSGGQCGWAQNDQPRIRIQDVDPDPDEVSWTWQRCNEWGYFHVANTGKHQIVLSDKNITFQQNYCTGYFKVPVERD